MMRSLLGLAVFFSLAAGCGDNLVPRSTQIDKRVGASAVGGAQIARSSSFMLVTSVGSEHAHTASNRSMTLQTGMGAQ